MTPLWEPSAKHEHDASLKRFIDKFDKASPLDISMSMWTEEKFVHDGDMNLWGIVVHYDWEKRQNWSGERFPFETLGEFERKFVPEKGIMLTIQCNAQETHFATAWHRNFDQVVDVSRKTEYEYNEDGRMRTTQNFRIFSYSDMAGFKRWLLTTYRGS